MHILDPQLRDLWYHSHPKKGTKGYYAYGAKHLRCIKTPRGFRIKNKYLPKDTPIYRYGFQTSEKMTVPHGPYVFKCQLPGVDLKDPPSIEEQIFPYSDKTLPRTGKKKLKVRCGTHYRIILLDTKVNADTCYIFGTNIRVPTQNIPKWMRRDTVVLPHPQRTTRDEIKCAGGKTYRTGRPEVGEVTVAGIPMRCTKIGQLCTVMHENKRYYAHASVVFKRHATGK